MAYMSDEDLEDYRIQEIERKHEREYWPAPTPEDDDSQEDGE